MTSAPRSASSRTQNGPATIWPKSRTRIPERGSGRTPVIAPCSIRMITENQADIDAGHAALAADDRRLGIRDLARAAGTAHLDRRLAQQERAARVTMR